ncbi:MAG: hypothetical protein P4L40_18300 [Terracidiphilus sp.]|nr:hypothetical protein [Terracidiphilus sp.]
MCVCVVYVYVCVKGPMTVITRLIPCAHVTAPADAEDRGLLSSLHGLSWSSMYDAAKGNTSDPFWLLPQAALLAASDSQQVIAVVHLGGVSCILVFV